MNNLPIEVLYNIFDQLCLTQKRECLFVSKHWSYVMRTRNLLKTVYISDSCSFDQFLELLKQEPKLAFQVESLTLVRCLAANFDRRHFLTYFPNLKEISISPIQGLFLNSRNFYHFSETQFHTLSKSADHLQYVEDTDECELTRYLIKNKLCSHLVTLKLHFSDEEYNSKSNMFSVLKNMPVLKNLILESPLLVKIDMLETIHNNIPSLESLEMSNAILLPSLLPVDVKPATLVNRLKINILDTGSDGRAEWLTYIRQKYTHLKYFNLNFGESLKDEGWVEVYEEQYPRLLQSLGSRLESLVLLGELDINNDVIKNLDRYGCELKELELFGCEDLDIFLDLLKNKQCKQIEKLALYGLSYDYEYDMNFLERMKHLKVLTLDYEELDIDVYSLSGQEISQIIDSHTTCLNTLFEDIPTSVESVVIKNGYWKFDASVGDYKNIKALTFDGIRLQQDEDFDEFMFKGTKKIIDGFIHNHFQNLHSLTLIDCFDEWDNIKLPGCRFSYLELTRNTACKDFDVCLYTEEDEKQRSYNAHRLTETGDYGWDNKRLPILSGNEDFGKYAVTVTCHSVKKLVVCEVECFLYSDKFEFQSF